jgi:signal transduction histidine kinase/CheY-like chemotaxis protein
MVNGMGSSVSRRFLIGLGATSLAFTAVTSIAAFWVFKQELEDRQVGFLAEYVRERTDNVDRRFSNLITLQRSAVDTLKARMSAFAAGEARTLLDSRTVELADGTRRSKDREFDGYVDADGGRVYGVGAFISKAKALAPQEQAALAAAFPIVSRFGQAAHGDYDNFYFYTPQTRLVMFGPDRPDRLMFYRHKAPATLDFSHDEMARIISPEENPAGETRCTPLQRLIQNKNRNEQRVGTACVTPVYVAGRLIGAFGSTIKLDGFLSRVVDDGLPEAATLIVRNDGRLIAAPKAKLSTTRDEAAVAAYETTLGLAGLTRQLAQVPNPSGVTRSADGANIIAYGRLKGPGWYLVLVYPAAAAAWSAAKSASWVLLLGLLGAVLQTAMLLALARRTIVRPLQTLAGSCESHDRSVSEALSGRSDEIGLLARSLTRERTRADDYLASMEARVRARTAELEHANAEKSRFLANMSHELRTPLNGIIAISENLAREQVTPRNVELAELIVDSGRLLEQVLTDILDFSKIEAGEMGLEARDFDLRTIVSRVAELHRASAVAKGIVLEWQVASEAEGHYLGDSVRLTQVLSNLLSNAVKFTQAGEVRLSVEAGPDGLSFRVADTGIGFDEQVRERLFQRFEQADLSIRRRFGGTGLGLAICRSLVELMGGRIGATSVPGKGSVFDFVLPLPRARAEAAPDEIARAETPVCFAGLHILLAEDHPTNQRVIQLILESVGADLTIVENGGLALAALETERYDLVLMDMQMPELDGLSATVQLRTREDALGLPRTPVIMLTANALDEHVQASLASGADRHLSKPVRAGELLRAIADLAFPQDSNLGAVAA